MQRTAFAVRFSIKIKEFLKLFIKRNAENQRKLGGRVELPCLNRAYRVARYTYHFGKLRLRHTLFLSESCDIVVKYKLIIHYLITPQS